MNKRNAYLEMYEDYYERFKTIELKRKEKET